MPRMIGIFADQRAAEDVIEHLALNGIGPATMLSASGQPGEVAARMQDLHTLRLPEQQAAEYRARLERNQCLVLIEASALDIPTVQRVLRNGHSVDIDLLPEPSP